MKPVLRMLATLALLDPCLASAQTIAPPDQAASAPLAWDALLEGFRNPPQSAKLRCYWWWMNGYTTVETITRELTAMKEKGYGGVLLVDDSDSVATDKSPMGPPYGSPAWMELYLHALKVAAGLGLEVSLEITDGGNVGILGGPGIGPEDAIKMLSYSTRRVSSPSMGPIKLPTPPLEGGYYRQIAVLAYHLKHGAALPGASGSGRQAIQALPLKLVTKEVGIYSMPDEDNIFVDSPSLAGEQDLNLTDVIDLTAQTDADGTVRWTAPAGEWEILRVGYTATTQKVSNPSGTGYAVDALSASAFDRYWNQVIAPILTASKPYIGKSLLYVVTDSWETGGANWTADFRKEFIARRGYDPVPYLPVVSGRIVESRDASNRFLADLRRTVADLITVNYYDHFAARAAEFGLGTHPESGGPHGAPIDALETFRSAAFPQGEFWAASPLHRTSDEDRFFVKEAASAAHIYGKRYVAAESFSTMNHPWSNSLATNLKPALDRALTEGLNRVIWHEFTSSPENFGKPGIEYFADTHLDPNVTWWDQAGPMLLAINRMQFLLQQGTPVADLLYYYGTQVPDFARLKSDDPASVLPGYDYDVTSQDALLHRMIATGGDLRTPEGIRYKALALPRSRAITLEDITWIQAYVRQGGVVIGLKPTAPLGNLPASQLDEYNRIASDMWDHCAQGVASYGKGRIFCTHDAHGALVAMEVAPDFSFRAIPGTTLDYIHRRTADTDIYFIRNANSSIANAVASFRVTGKAPDVWNADTAEGAPAAIYRENGPLTEVPLSLSPFGSAFILFHRPSSSHAVEIRRNGAQIFPSIDASGPTYGGASMQATQADHYTVVYTNGEHRSLDVPLSPAQLHLKGTWTLSFVPGWGAPASIPVTHFASWTESSIPDVRFFSGTGTYTNTIQVKSALLDGKREVWMDLGDVHELATVSINGQELRTLWHAPFSLRIDAALRGGENTISVRVTNLWPNRLIGDQQPDTKVHYTHTNIEAYTKDSPLLPSGLLTPVTFHVSNTVSFP